MTHPEPRTNPAYVAGFGSTVALVSLLIAAPQAARADDWSSLGLVASRGRVSGERSGASFAAGEWRHRIDEVQLVYRELAASPAVADGFVVVGTPRHQIRVLRETDGQLLWQAAVGDSNLASPAIWRGLVLVLGTDQKLSALNLADGKAVWTADLGGIGYASPIVVDDSVYVAVGSPAARVLRIDAATGHVRWRAGEGVFKQSPFASVAVADGHVIIGETGGLYHSFATGDGHPEWTFNTGGEIYLSSALVADGRAYLLSGGTKVRLHAVDVSTGLPLDGWPMDIAIPEDGAGSGTRLEREHTISSCAGGADLLSFQVRVDDRLDSNSDGQLDSVLMRQFVFAVKPAVRQLAWVTANGRLKSDDEDAIPDFGIVGTPALYSAAGGQLLAVTSSVAPRLSVLAASSGTNRWSMPLAGPARSSPVLANGRLVVTTDAGVVHSFLSVANQPPVAPVMGLGPTGAGQADAAGTVVTWGTAIDAEGGDLSYELRVDDDGEVLRDWDVQTTTLAQRQVLPPLPAGQTYSYSIRARDSQGALSAWTELQTFQTVATPAVLVNDQPATSLAEAVAGARPGTIIRLGAGVYRLSSTLQLPPGTSLQGQAPHQTTLDARGLAVGISLSSGSAVSQLTVTGARVGAAVQGASDVQLRNVILRDNAETGLRVGTTGSADLVSATVVRNGTGVLAAGTTRVRNSLITRNDVGLAASTPEALASAYNNVHDNRMDDYRGVFPGHTDLALTVRFASSDADDFHLQRAQGTTDRGDPADEYQQEPQPNGGRINIGAFGNTPFAEVSGELQTENGPVAPSEPGPPAPNDPSTGRAAGGGCALATTGGDSPGGSVALVLAGLLLLGRWRRRTDRR